MNEKYVFKIEAQIVSTNIANYKITTIFSLKYKNNTALGMGKPISTFLKGLVIIYLLLNFEFFMKLIMLKTR